MPYLPAISIHNPLKKSNTAFVLTLKKHGTRNQGSRSITLHQGECLTILDGNQIYLPNILDLIYHQKKGERPFKVEFSKPNPSMLLIPENSIKKTLYYDCSYLFNLTFFLDKKIKKSVIPRKIIKSIRKEFEFQIGEKINLNSISSLNKYELTDLIYYRALLQRPDIVVIYQPFIDVDMDLQPHIEDLINQLKERMITVLVLTSYMANLELVSDQVVKIENGTYFQ